MILNMTWWIKYSPIFYTYYTRILSLKEIIYYIWTFILPSLAWIFYLWLKNPEFSLVTYSLYYILFYFIFQCFYEIWYIFNDVYAIKKENNKTKRIKWEYSDFFWLLQIIFRIILWLLLLIFTLNISKYWFRLLSLDIGFMWIMFTIHNVIRNYSINIFTWIFLRIARIILFVIILKISGISPDFYKDIEISILLFYALDFYWARLYQYNKRLGWVNSFNYGYSYFFILIVLFFFFILLEKIEYLVPLIIIIPKIFFFLLTTPKTFSLKNDR